MIQVTPQMRILLAVEPVDFRKGIDGLAMLCKMVLREDPFAGYLFVFLNRRKTSIKVLSYDGQGFWMCQKRLSKGKFGWWPDNSEDPVKTLADVEFINKLIKTNPKASRYALSKELCKAWNWVQANGALRDMVARGFMLALHREGHIKLPAKKNNPNNPFVNRKKPEKIEIDQTRINATLSQIQPVQIKQVRGTPDEKLFNSLIEFHHYLGYCHPVGEQLKYMVYVKNRPISCFSWSSAPSHIGARDRYIGWTKQDRDKNLGLMAYNSRFLILPWVVVPHLASYLLGLMAKNIARDWERIYNHPVYFLETFVDTERFLGTCYKAANWKYLGDTTGRGKDEKTQKKTRSIKAVWGYPLTKKFRSYMTA